MTFTERQVAQGQKLVASLSKAKWGLGDLALEVVPPDDARMPTDRAELDKFAEAIGLTGTTLMEYRRVALAYPPARRRYELSWTVHRELASNTAIEDPARVLHQRKAWTATTVRIFLEQKGAASRLPAGGTTAVAGNGVSAGQRPLSGPISAGTSREDRVRIAREVLAEPDVVREVLRDPVVRRVTDEATVDLNREAFATRESQPVRPGLMKSLEFRDLVSHARGDMLKAVQAWAALDGTPNPDAIEDHLETLRTIRDAAGGLIDALETGTSLDAVLADILGADQ